MKVWVANIKVTHVGELITTDVDAFYTLGDAVSHYRDIYSNYVEVSSDELVDEDNRAYSFYIHFKDLNEDFRNEVSIWFKPAILDWSHRKSKPELNEELSP